MLSCVVSLTAARAGAQGEDTEKQPRLDVYGFAMLDIIGDFKQVDPDWFDVVRPTKLPAFANEFGHDGHTYFSVRQSRIGTRAFFPTGLGELKTVLEFELFGVGAQAGQTILRLRHAYGELGPILAGQTNAVFMDGDVFPNTVEYWGPNGMPLFRNVQLRYTKATKANTFMIALERPGASADAGDFANRVEVANVRARFPVPDLSAAVKHTMSWGYLRAAGVVRRMNWDSDTAGLSGSATGWGINASSNVNATKKDILRLQAVYGHGVQNYLNDAPVDVGATTDPNSPDGFNGKALPMWSMVAYLDHTWNERFTSSIGYSRLDVENSNGQLSDAFKYGQYASANVAYYPVKNALMAAELIWGNRANNSDGFSSSDVRLQVSFKYNFSATIGKGGTQ
jgi:hypothetical protein